MAQQEERSEDRRTRGRPDQTEVKVTYIVCTNA